jgi:cobalt-precorrin-6B (C15)-methyltransferase
MKLAGGPTQDEIMAISLYKLGLRHGDVFADVGCGTGKISVEAARTAAKVYAIDLREEAIEHARALASARGASNIELMHGEATDIIPRIGDLDCAFIGGSKNLPQVLEALSPKVKGNIVVNAVLLDTVMEAVDTMVKLGIFREVVHVQVAKSRPLGDSIMFSPINPVYIIAGGRGSC